MASKANPIDLQLNPVQFVEIAHAWAAGGEPPTEEHEQVLRELDRPLLTQPAEAREALWGVLTYPERGKALTWLDRAGLLEELLPCWCGDYFRQALRLQAAEEVHLERWADGLGKSAFDWLCVYMDEKVEGRLNGWALASLSALLLSGDEPADRFSVSVERDLRALGAKDGERDRVVSAVREFPALYDCLMSSETTGRVYAPTTLVATLATLQVIPYIQDDTRVSAVRMADRILAKFAA